MSKSDTHPHDQRDQQDSESTVALNSGPDTTETSLSECHFLTVNPQEKASRLANMMYTISMQESTIAFTRNQLQTLNKDLEESNTTITKMRSEMNYYSQLTHIDPATKAAGMGYMAQQISLQESQNTAISNQIDQGSSSLENLTEELDKMELHMNEFRKLPVC